MANTNFTNNVTVVDATWLNDVNRAVYEAIGDGTDVPLTPDTVRENIGLGTPTGAARMPAGTTAQRPTPVVGSLRGNTTTGQWEGSLDGSTWSPVAGNVPNDSVTTAMLQNDAVTFAKVQNIPTGTILGRSTAGTGDVEALTGEQVTALLSGSLPVAVDVPAARLSGTVATARLGTGTANNTTFLRGDSTWQSISVTPSTADVLTATAGAAVGAVGTYAFLSEADVGNFNNVTAGSTRAGSTLRYNGFRMMDTLTNTATGGGANASPAGTWRAMGTVDKSGIVSAAFTLWLRIS